MAKSSASAVSRRPFWTDDAGRLIPAAAIGVVLHAVVAALCFLIPQDPPRSAARVSPPEPAPDVHFVSLAEPGSSVGPETDAPVTLREARRSGPATVRASRRAVAKVPPAVAVATRVAAAAGGAPEPDAAAGDGAATAGGDAATTGSSAPGGDEWSSTRRSSNNRSRPTLVGSMFCDGFFPYRAHDDDATVRIAVRVDPAGAPATLKIEKESPAGEGFGVAAQSCLKFARFRAATDRGGLAVASTARLEVTFHRRR
jgi:hypothetical protein